MRDDDPTRTQALDSLAPAPPRQLMIVGPRAVQFVPLAGAGSVTIGRTDRSVVVVEDDRLSREHLRVSWAANVEVEDLGSANGTFVDDARLRAHTLTPIRPGQPVNLGHSVVLVQDLTPRARMRVLETHEAFESIVARACERAERGARMSVLRVHLQGSAADRTIHDALTRPLTQDDAIAAYAPGEFEIFLASADAVGAESVAGQLEMELGKLGLASRIGTSTFPEDGRTTDALLVHASPRDIWEVSSPQPLLLSEQTRALSRLIERIAQGSISVLLQGETGVGKDVFAELLHRRSPRAQAPFVRINCATLSDSLLESELFGHCKGAFTGAHSERVGLLESANGGTVFLDELGELAPTHQAALLVAVERREIVRVGSTKPTPIDVRFVAATNRDLEHEVAERRFRRDLLHRLNGVVVDIPPLRERSAEIVPLALTFLRTLTQQSVRRLPPSFTSEAIALLSRYPWPGNVRELRNVVERALLLATGDHIGVEHLPLGKLRTTWGAAQPPQVDATAKVETLSDADRAERARMMEALRETRGNQTHAAALLGVPRRTFTHRMNRLGVRGARGVVD